ncbi:MAG: ATP synthase F1 subunit epsilon [Elusimicrobia bacterium]|nr:ATP synthase F1 subunit epsilon [Elusimicrobiota bacterium]
MHTFDLEIMSLEGLIFKGAVTSAILPAVGGEITVYADHEDIIANLHTGDIILTLPENSGQTKIKTTGGFLEVLSNKVNILSYYAADIAKVSEEKILKARQRADDALKESAKQNKLVEIFSEYETKRNIAEIRANVLRKTRIKG